MRINAAISMNEYDSKKEVEEVFVILDFENG
jgi:hypothetical protein